MSYELKASELRAGNWVYEPSFGRYVQISTAGIDCVKKGQGVILSISLDKDVIDRSELKLMPETEYTRNTYDLCGLKLWHTNGKFLFLDEIEIKSVHNLQNIYFELSGGLELKFNFD